MSSCDVRILRGVRRLATNYGVRAAFSSSHIVNVLLIGQTMEIKFSRTCVVVKRKKEFDDDETRDRNGVRFLAVFLIGPCTLALVTGLMT